MVKLSPDHHFPWLQMFLKIVILLTILRSILLNFQKFRRVPAGISAKTAFGYILSIYKDEPNTITVENCVELFKLADYWCDEHMKEETKRFMERNLTESILRDISKDGLYCQFSDIMDRVIKRAFDKCTESKTCSECINAMVLKNLKAKQGMCERELKIGEFYYICKDCSEKDIYECTGILCEPCFKSGVHVDHNYTRVASKGSAHCDCGKDYMFKSGVWCRTCEVKKDYDINIVNKSFKS